MKRILSLILCFVLVAALAGCGKGAERDGSIKEPTATAKQETEATKPAETTSPAETATETQAPTEKPEVTEPTTTVTEPSETEKPTEQTPAIDFDIPWTTVVYPLKDGDGYTYEAEVKISPWIFLEDSDLLSAAWDEVGGGKKLPQFDDWGFKRSGSSYAKEMTYYSSSHSQNYAWNITNMYYSVGTVTIRNTTSGFSITQDNPRSVKFTWGYDYIKPVACAGKVILSDKDITRIGGLYVPASMKSNTWGPVSFVMMTPEYISPNTPNGMAEYILSEEVAFDFKIADYTLGAGIFINNDENTAVHLGILKSDGEYITE